MGSELARFTSTCIRFAQKAIVGPPAPAVQRGDGGSAEWVIVILHGLTEHLGHSNRQFLDVLPGMPRIVRQLDLSME
jgi:hypothetical protein